MPRCKGQEVTASGARAARLGPGTCVSRRVMAGDVMQLADGHVTGLAGCGSTLLQGSGEGNTNLSSDFRSAERLVMN